MRTISIRVADHPRVLSASDSELSKVPSLAVPDEFENPNLSQIYLWSANGSFIDFENPHFKLVISPHSSPSPQTTHDGPE